MIAEAPKSKRLSTWKIVGIGAAVVVGILLIAGFWIRSVTETRWARLREELKGRAERERARDPRRPVLRGTAEPGNAWEEYGLAIAEMKKVPDRMKLVDLVQRTPKADPAWGVVALERNQIILEHLRAGASRSTSRQDYEWEKGSSMPLPGIGESNPIVSLAILKARFLLEAGQPREAVAVLLDAAQFARDLADDGPMIAQFVGFKILSTVLYGLRELSASEKANAESLADMDQGLAALEANFPKLAACLGREQLVIGMTFAGEGASALPSGPAGMLPQKFLFLSAFGRLQAHFDEAAKESEVAWADFLVQAKRIDPEIYYSRNPMMKLILPPLTSSERTVREGAAQLRLLRVAAWYRRTGELLDLDDPFGAKLKSAKSGEGMRFWSVGRDGVDDGGVGEWLPKAGADIVLEARR